MAKGRRIVCRVAARILECCGFTATALLSSAPCLLPSVAAAEVSRPANVTPPSVASGSIVQIIFSLLLVLAAIMLVAWLLKRMNVVRQGSGNLIRVLGGASLGQRERILLVEVGDTWLVVGVGPGQIRTLHTLDRPEGAAPDEHPKTPGKSRFAAILGDALGQHSNKETKDS